jgi:hypothetical protein
MVQLGGHFPTDVHGRLKSDGTYLAKTKELQQTAGAGKRPCRTDLPPHAEPVNS